MKTLVGLDLVDCARFAHWLQFSDRALQRVFSPEEITYCRISQVHSASRFAVRFAAREAFYKALTSLQYNQPMPFLLLCRSAQVTHAHSGSPEIIFNHKALEAFYAIHKIAHVSLSLSHTTTTAGAVVIITLK